MGECDLQPTKITMTSIRPLLLLATFLPLLLAEPGIGSSIPWAKKFSINMMDPLTRRSALDKNFVRFGRSNGGVNRENRGRPDSFVRFGRGLDDENFDDVIGERDIRGKTDFIRFGRANGNKNNAGFIRFGRGRNDNFVRFGRARQDSFIRFGKKSDDYLDSYDENDLQRSSRAGGNRLNTNFVRFGKRVPENDEEIVNAYKNGLNINGNPFRSEHLARISRYNKNRGDSFIRFGRLPSTDDEFPRQLTTSTKGLNIFGNKLQKHPPSTSDENQIYPEDNSESDSESDQNTSSSNVFETSVRRKKRSPLSKNDLKKPLPTIRPEDLPEYNNYPSQLAAGLPNFIIGPELSVLPPHAKSRTSGKKIDDKNFIRLG